MQPTATLSRSTVEVVVFCEFPLVFACCGQDQGELSIPTLWLRATLPGGQSPFALCQLSSRGVAIAHQL